MSKSRVELNIAEVMMPAATPGGEFHLRDALERELTRLFAESGPSGLLRRDRHEGRLEAKLSSCKIYLDKYNTLSTKVVKAKKQTKR